MRLDGRTELRHVVDLDLVHNVAEQVAHAQLLVFTDAGVLFGSADCAMQLLCDCETP